MQLEMSTKTEGFEPVHIAEGIYTATLKEVKDIAEGTYGPRITFIYEVEGKEIALVCYKTKATVDNKLGQTLMAHGIQISDGKINTEDIKSKQVKAWVEDYEREKDGKKITSSIISKVKVLV